MDTTLPLPFLPSIDLNGSPDSSEGLTRAQLSDLGIAHFAAKSENIDSVLQFLQKHVIVEAYVDVRAVKATNDIISILDAGARKVFVTPGQQSALSAYADRLIPAYSANEAPLSGSYPNGVLLEIDQTKTSLAQLAASKTSPIFLTTSSKNLETIVTLARQFEAVPILPSTSLTIDKASEGQVSVSGLIAGGWTSDRADKLVPTVVTDERGIALGLVYSSQESLVESLKTGAGVYKAASVGFGTRVQRLGTHKSLFEFL
jgi:phosphoribosyl-ATP pyrophosphohydrolase/phosphoribosyl-AMP cyclohydrolase/histidinol dehydrogenase